MDVNTGPGKSWGKFVLGLRTTNQERFLNICLFICMSIFSACMCTMCLPDALGDSGAGVTDGCDHVGAGN